jgi:DNA-binding GntR family transcriptional regulator
MARSSLSPLITARIIEHIRNTGMKRDQHLPSQMLADTFRVSRAPVNDALRALEKLKIVRSEPNRGYFLLKDAGELEETDLALGNDGELEDEWYFAIAEDRLSGKLPERVSENELMRLYGLPRSRILKILHQIADEGWAERLPGNGWAFRHILTSRESYEQGYQFRAVIEQQSLLLSTFKIDREAFLKAREEQQALLEGDFNRVSRSTLFRANSGFHEMLVGCARNEFFLESIKRINRLRRLIEYRITVDRSRLPVQCREHLHILDLIETGDREQAADFLRIHITGAARIKGPQMGGR